MFKQTMIGLAGAAALGVGFAGSAEAGVLYENAYSNGIVTSGPGFCSGCNGDFRVFDFFTLSADSHVTAIDTQLFGLADSDGDINYSIWSSDLTQELFSFDKQATDIASTTIINLDSDTTADFNSTCLQARII